MDANRFQVEGVPVWTGVPHLAVEGLLEDPMNAPSPLHRSLGTWGRSTGLPLCLQGRGVDWSVPPEGSGDKTPNLHGTAYG